MIDIRGAIGHLRLPPGFRSCRLSVFRHPELITGQTIKARHLCLMSKNTETGVTRLRFGELFRDCLFSRQSSFARSFYTTTTPTGAIISTDNPPTATTNMSQRGKARDLSGRCRFDCGLD
jgi:hypothetical protein